MVVMLKRQAWTRVLVYGAVALIFVTAASILYLHSKKRVAPMIFSNNAMLAEMWSSYKKTIIEPGTYRALDRELDNITTSEGQSYTMLRAVWMDDQIAFDLSLKWTKQYLQRPDHLFAWRWGPKPDGTYGIQDHLGGQNTASDADCDIALALIMASKRWDDPSYLEEAKRIIKSVWEREVVMIKGKPVLVALDLESDPRKQEVIINPSYFSPFEYKVFATIDPKHDWLGLSDNSYDILLDVSEDKLTSRKSSGLVPDWVSMNKATGKFGRPAKGQTTDYGWDAVRTPWRLALDWQWYKDPRAKQVLAKLHFLGDQWHKHGQLKAIYSHDGSVVGDYESLSMYGTAMGYFLVIDPAAGKEVYKRKLQVLYNPDTQSAVQGLRYFDANWVWFGIALVHNALPNLTEL
jgi:endo-1,4-beta-D-glucanase Y